MKTDLSLSLVLGSVILAAAPAPGQPIHPHHESLIRKAAAEVKPRVAPRKPRTVLIWNTPPAFMDKDPHKGYCIPYGEAAMRILGETSGAFKAVVSDDVRTYLPERLKHFDAIVLNNASGPWIRPTDADMEKFKGLGDKDTVERLLRKAFLDWLSSGRGIVA